LSWANQVQLVCEWLGLVARQLWELAS